ncbi:DUF995 domain-containing protein [Planctomicrobium piriforme]|uniref:Uncharacterized protein n=1 Tax=Planctomicrobium piriforme TaxID=1576369 RepID=A0A1I3E6Y9_9PLAN|nr:DUF995 domain-containing protein [Planctomicrobium piriforme]SFH94724.1 Protein of unknown function [Planctomicrobium piriforme]
MAFRWKNRLLFLLALVAMTAVIQPLSGDESTPAAPPPPTADGVTFVEVSPPDVFPYLLKGRPSGLGDDNRYLGRDDRFCYIHKNCSNTVYYCKSDEVSWYALRRAQMEQDEEYKRFWSEVTVDTPFAARRLSETVPAWLKKAGLNRDMEPTK